MKRPTTHQLEALPFVSVRGERYLNYDALVALLEELDRAEEAKVEQPRERKS